MKTVVEQVLQDTEEIRRAAKASKKELEDQINKYKEKLSGLQNVLEGPSYIAHTICSGFKSVFSWFTNLFIGRRQKRNACGIPRHTQIGS